MDALSQFKCTRFVVAFLTFVVVFMPYVFFLACHVRFYAEKNLLPVGILIVILGLVTLALFIATSISNPGYVKKLGSPYRVYDVLRQSYRTSIPPRFVDVIINGQPIKLKYCITCHIYRPPRTVHCSDCNKCILKFDHHCPYVSNCIGYYNYKIFMGFVATCCLYYSALFATFVYRSVEFFPKFPGNISDSPFDIIGTIVFIILVFLSIWVIFGLYFFHLFIIGKNLSTYDKLKEHFDDFNPFHRGTLNNCRSLFLYHPKRIKATDKAYTPNAMYDITVEPKKLDETQLN